MYSHLVNQKLKNHFQIVAVRQEVRAIRNNVTSVESDLQQLGSRLLTGQVAGFKDHATIAGLQNTAKSLEAEVNRLSNQVSLLHLTSAIKLTE